MTVSPASPAKGTPPAREALPARVAASPLGRVDSEPLVALPARVAASPLGRVDSEDLEERARVVRPELVHPV